MYKLFKNVNVKAALVTSVAALGLIKCHEFQKQNLLQVKHKYVTDMSVKFWGYGVYVRGVNGGGNDGRWEVQAGFLPIFCE